MDSLEINVRSPVLFSAALSTLSELALITLFGPILFPEGDLLAGLIWFVLVCGLGGGALLGVLLRSFVVGQLRGSGAVAMTSALSALVLGVGCSLLCWEVNSVAGFMGEGVNRGLFFANGIILSWVGGYMLGWLMFTPKGGDFLKNLKP